jgi:hypothetical protein
MTKSEMIAVVNGYIRDAEAQGGAWHGWAGRGEAGPGEARLGKARQGNPNSGTLT